VQTCKHREIETNGHLSCVCDDLSGPQARSLPLTATLLRQINDKMWKLLRSAADRVNSLACKGNYGATSNDMKLVHWPLMGGLLHSVQ